MEYSTAKLREEKVFRDPIHRYVYVTDLLISELIDTAEFQRLRRIRQLGTSSITFHGAEHSRFNHSLGVYEIVRRMIDESFSERKGWVKSERLVALCAGLLHDLGHGPFSHSFEKVFGLDHEEFTRSIILGDTEVNAVLQKVSADFPSKVASIIEKTYANKLVVSLISSQVDADRMDYLIRDAYYTGVSYGKFDLERMLRVIRPSQNGLVIKASGMHMVEDYIMCRYQMYRQIYFHPVSSSTEVLLTNIFKRAKKLYEAGFAFKQVPAHFESIFRNEINIADYLKLDEAVCSYYFSIWQEESDPILSDLSRRFLTRNLYSHLEFQSERDQGKFVELQQLFHQVGIDPEYYLTINSSSNVAYDHYIQGVEERQPVSLLLPDGRLEELTLHSPIVAAINGLKDKYEYLYFPKDLVMHLPESAEKMRIKEILELDAVVTA